jgi:hypothetical protein
MTSAHDNEWNNKNCNARKTMNAKSKIYADLDDFEFVAMVSAGLLKEGILFEVKKCFTENDREQWVFILKGF